jgi:cobalt/nickel transport protein
MKNTELSPKPVQPTDTSSKPVWKINVLLILLVIVIAATPLVIIRGAEFSGADGQAGDAITEIAPDYEPWAASLLIPASGEIESMLFSLQAAIGAGVLCFLLGRVTAKPKPAATPKSHK